MLEFDNLQYDPVDIMYMTQCAVRMPHLSKDVLRKTLTYDTYNAELVKYDAETDTVCKNRTQSFDYDILNKVLQFIKADSDVKN
jgi:beta-lactamase class A